MKSRITYPVVSIFAHLLVTECTLLKSGGLLAKANVEDVGENSKVGCTLDTDMTCESGYTATCLGSDDHAATTTTNLIKVRSWKCMCAASPMTSSACSYTKTRDGVSTIHKDAIGYYEFFAHDSNDTTVDANKTVETLLKMESHYDAYQTARLADITAFLALQATLSLEEKNNTLGETQDLSNQTSNSDCLGSNSDCADFSIPSNCTMITSLADLDAKLPGTLLSTINAKLGGLCDNDKWDISQVTLGDFYQETCPEKQVYKKVYKKYVTKSKCDSGESCNATNESTMRIPGRGCVAANINTYNVKFNEAANAMYLTYGGGPRGKETGVWYPFRAAVQVLQCSDRVIGKIQTQLDVAPGPTGFAGWCCKDSNGNPTSMFPTINDVATNQASCDISWAQIDAAWRSAFSKIRFEVMASVL